MNEFLVEELVPVAAELVGTVRDYGPEDVATVLSRVPGGRHDALAVVLAAMVDPEKTPDQLLQWMETPVVSKQYPIDRPRGGGRRSMPREHGTERGYQQHRHLRELPACDACRLAHKAHNVAREAARRNGQD